MGIKSDREARCGDGQMLAFQSSSLADGTGYKFLCAADG